MYVQTRPSVCSPRADNTYIISGALVIVTSPRAPAPAHLREQVER